MLIPKTRRPLPPRAIPTFIVGHDTRDQAAENRRRITDYLELLQEQNLPLPAAPHQPDVLGIARIADEAGVSLGVLRPAHPLRQHLEKAIPKLGLAVIVEDDLPADQLTIAECRTLFAALAPARAAEVGMKQAAMEGFISRLFDLLMARAKDDPDAPALPLVRRMQRDAKADLLEIDDNVRTILEEFDDWVALRKHPGRTLSGDALASMAFRDLLLIGMEQTGLSQGKIAALLQIPQSTLWKWLQQGRAPNARSYPALRTLSHHFGFAEETLIRSIARLKGGKGVRLPLSLFPAQHRERRAGDLRKSVQAHLTDDDLQLSDEALRDRIARLCEQHSAEREPAKRRKAMRDINRIDRSRFSPRLCDELERYRADLASQNRSPETQTSYCNHLEGFFHFAIATYVPDSPHRPLGEVEFAHVASRPLWEAYFRHLTSVGRSTMGPEFLIARAIVERMKAVSAIFDPDQGFTTKNKDIFARVLKLDEQHFPGFLTDHPQVLMREIHKELKGLRGKWMRKSQKPTKGRDEIADILSNPDPMIAVRQTISHLRWQKNQVRKWTILSEGDTTPRLNHHYATALRRLVLIHLLGQTALRIGMIPGLTVGLHAAGAHLEWAGEKPILKIPANLFKNGKSEVFKEGPYERVLENIDGVYEDLREYLDIARPRLLDGAQNNLLFLAWSAEKGCRPAQAAILRNEITQATREAVGLDAPPGKRLTRARHLRPHHFRDILATTVLHRTDRNYALAGDAIHVTESTARAYYAHDSVEMRRPELQKVMQAIAANAP